MDIEFENVKEKLHDVPINILLQKSVSPNPNSESESLLRDAKEPP